MTKLTRRSALALPLVAAVAPSVASASEPRACEVRSLIALEPGDWGLWHPLPGPKPIPPVVGKWHAATANIQSILRTHPECRPPWPDRIEVDLLDATRGRHWLDGEKGFEAGPLRLDREAAFDIRRNDMIMLTVSKRTNDFRHHINAGYAVGKHGWAFSGCRLLEQDQWLWDKRNDGLWFIRIRVPLGES